MVLDKRPFHIEGHAYYLYNTSFTCIFIYFRVRNMLKSKNVSLKIHNKKIQFSHKIEYQDGRPQGLFFISLISDILYTHDYIRILLAKPSNTIIIQASLTLSYVLASAF